MSLFVIYAPNVHNGGGLVLLQSLLRAWPKLCPLTVFLNDRARETIHPPNGVKVFWVASNLSSRIQAELSLRKVTNTGCNTVFCFHGLPPLLCTPPQVLVFLQNRLLIESSPLSQFKLKTRLRLNLERLISRFFRNRVTEYIVQTPSMRRSIEDWCRKSGSSIKSPKARVLPFMDIISKPNLTSSHLTWNFAYIAFGEAHKNHKTLLAAWQILAREGLYPSLALTLSKYDKSLALEIEMLSKQNKLQIFNIGQLPSEEVLRLYTKIDALIYPSITESFGLPLIEASQMNVPILAPELDYVRDVCTPAQTFDPHSPVSIARAVKRFLGHSEKPLQIHSPTEFWDTLLPSVDSS